MPTTVDTFGTLLAAPARKTGTLLRTSRRAAYRALADLVLGNFLREVQQNPPLHRIGPERSPTIEASLWARPMNGLTLSTAEMVMYFRLKSLPELADLPPDRRKEVWREARRDPFRAADFAWLLLILVLIAVLAVGLVLLPKSLPIWIGLPAYIAGFWIMSQFLNAVMICRYRPVIRRLRASGG